jgi:hypothetical protein
MFTPGLWRTFEKIFSVFLLKDIKPYASWILPQCAVVVLALQCMAGRWTSC